MTEFYHHEQQPELEQTKLTEQSSLLTRSTMPSFYPSTRQRTFLTKHLTDDDDSDSIYKEAFIIQVFQHWKIKTLEHQHPENITAPNHFSQALANKAPPAEPLKTEVIPDVSPEISPKDEVAIVDKSEKPIITMQKRVTPIPASYTRRKNVLKKSVSAPNDFSNPNLLTPYVKTKPGTGTSTTTRKCAKPAPIFIAPKKTQPSPPPRSIFLFSFDESVQTKRKATLERQSSLTDEQNTIPSPTWAPAPPTTPTRFYIQSPGTSVDDKGTSSDESDHESLLIRNKKILKKTSKKKAQYNIAHLTIPTAIYITDIHGHSRTFDPDNDSMEDMERIVDNDFMAMNINSACSNGVFDYSSSATLPTTPSSSTVLDKYALHSIGEEEEETVEKNNHNGIILSKELDRIEAFKRSRQTNLDEHKKDNESVQYDKDKIPLGRRWSDSVVSDDEEHIRLPQSSLVKMASTTSVVKQPVTPPVKISKTKLLLMKLHLTPSPSKDNDSSSSTHPPPRKRTVRRSSDKKRYQTH
jgi:hypothetical protein